MQQEVARKQNFGRLLTRTFCTSALTGTVAVSILTLARFPAKTTLVTTVLLTRISVAPWQTLRPPNGGLVATWVTDIEFIRVLHTEEAFLVFFVTSY